MAAKEIKGSVLPIVGDMANNKDLDNLVSKTLNTFGKIDIVVNNAGMFSGSSVHETKSEDWNKIMNTNINSVFQLAKRVLPHMMERKTGTFVHIASIAGLVAIPGVAAYQGFLPLCQSNKTTHTRNYAISWCLFGWSHCGDPIGDKNIVACADRLSSVAYYLSPNPYCPLPIAYATGLACNHTKSPSA